MIKKTQAVSTLVFTLLSAACGLSTSAHAASAPALTQQECHEYPFVHVTETTQAQRDVEMGELEAAGYKPAGDDPTYPADLDRAERKVHAEYRADCLPAARNGHAS